MMYLFDFFGFLFHELSVLLTFAVIIGTTTVSVFQHLVTLVQSFPLWLSGPFIGLLSIAIIFRVSQFVPTIGGAS